MKGEDVGTKHPAVNETDITIEKIFTHVSKPKIGNASRSDIEKGEKLFFTHQKDQKEKRENGHNNIQLQSVITDQTKSLETDL